MQRILVCWQPLLSCFSISMAMQRVLGLDYAATLTVGQCSYHFVCLFYCFQHTSPMLNDLSRRLMIFFFKFRSLVVCFNILGIWSCINFCEALGGMFLKLLWVACVIRRAFRVPGLFTPSEILAWIPFSVEVTGHGLLDINFFCTVNHSHRDWLKHLLGFHVVCCILADWEDKLLHQWTNSNV